MESWIKNFFDSQLNDWDLVRNNFDALKCMQRKYFKLKDLEGCLQFNPARAGSTLAKIDKDSLEHRKCFLCKKNRPPEQRGIEILPGWELLVNPFPILPYHFTIANKGHFPQKLQWDTGIELAKILPGFVVFYNDDGAGASAPDHIHFQAVPQENLPIIKILNSSKGKQSLKFPFKVSYRKEEITTDPNPKNVYFWLLEENNEIKFIGIPRKNHRPQEFFMDFPKRRSISPGAIDMAGILVTPIKEDFLATKESDLENIYNQVGFPDE